MSLSRNVYKIVDYFITVVFSPQDIKEVDEYYFDEDYFPVQIKASLSQVLAIYLSSNSDKAVKASARIFTWLRNPLSQLGYVMKLTPICFDSIQLTFLIFLLNQADTFEFNTLLLIVTAIQSRLLSNFILSLAYNHCQWQFQHTVFSSILQIQCFPNSFVTHLLPLLCDRL